MQEAHSNKHPNDLDVIDLRELFYVLWDGKWIILSLTTFASIFAVIYSLSLPNIYESKALLVPAKSSSSISGALRSYGGLASLAGISLPSGGDDGNSSKAIQKMKSLSFFENNILTNIDLPDLMAFKSWDAETNTVLYNSKIYDTTTNKWILKDSDPTYKMPSVQKSYYAFKSKLNLIVDKKLALLLYQSNINLHS